MRDKNHPFWKAVRLAIGLIDTVFIGVSACVRCVVSIPFMIALIIFIGYVPKGALEVGED